jgi:ribosomal-protein-alanine N-acetyltransferase
MTKILQTNRLLLRPFKDKDLSIIFRYRNDERCAKYQTWQDRNIKELQSFFYAVKSKEIGDDWIQLAIARKLDDLLVGDIYLAFELHNISLGYTIDYLYHRQGFAFEILSETIKYLRTKYPSKQITAKVFTGNKASINLLLKLGFKKVGIIEKEDTYVYMYDL